MAFIHHKFGKTFFKKITSKSRNKKTPVIMIHGGPGGTHSYFLPLLGTFKDHDVYLYDQIGGGLSSPIAEKHWSIETFVHELSILAKNWKLEKFILFGVSWGTSLALEYYLKTKDARVEKIIFQSPLFSAKDWQADADRLILMLPNKTQKIINYCHEIGATDSKVYKKALDEYYAKHVFRKPKNFKKSKPRPPNPGGDQIYSYMWGPSEFKATGTLKSYERVSKLKTLNLPVLLICGKHDESTPTTVQRYHQLISGSEFKVIPKSSHIIASENPKALSKTIRNFLK